MKGRDLTELAVRNLREAVLRNSLTTLGVAVGVASLVAMLSLGCGIAGPGVATVEQIGFVRCSVCDVAARRTRNEHWAPGRAVAVTHE